MKIMRRLHLILLFAMCSLLFQLPRRLLQTEMDPEPEIEMDPEPEQTKKEKSKRPR